MTCSSSRTWAYMSVNIPCSPGNSKGGAGWRSCHSWFCEVLQIRHAIGSPSVRNSSFISSPGRLDLSVKSRSSLLRAGTNQALWSRCRCNSRHCGWILPHMLGTSYFFVCGESYSRPLYANCSQHRHVRPHSGQGPLEKEIPNLETIIFRFHG